MKLTIWIAGFWAGLSFLSHGADQAGSANLAATSKNTPQVKFRTAHESEFEVTSSYNDPGGSARIATNRFFQFQSGLNYFDGQERVESDEIISIESYVDLADIGCYRSAADFPPNGRVTCLARIAVANLSQFEIEFLVLARSALA